MVTAIFQNLLLVVSTMDVVYPYLKNYSRELEWSIYSLKYYDRAGQVLVIGDQPDYDIPAQIIKAISQPWWRLSPYNNVIAKLKQACNLIEGDWLCMMDDIFLLSDYEPTTYDRGNLQRHIDQSPTGSYQAGLRNTLAYLEKKGYPTISYETHTPMVFNSRKLLDLIESIEPYLASGHNLMIRSLYGNIYGSPSVTLDADTKNPSDYRGRSILSTNEESFVGAIGGYIRDTLNGNYQASNSRLRIAANIHYYIEEHGSGGEHYVHSLLKELAKKHDVTAFVSDDNLPNTTIDGVKVNYTDNIRDHEFDLLITHFQKTLESQQIARDRFIPLVTLVHNNMPATKQWLKSSPPRGLVVYNSQWVKNDIGLSGMVLHPQARPIKKHPKVKQDKVLLVNLIPEKGSDLFFELAKQMPHVKFLGVRGGYYKTRQQQVNLPNLEIIDNTPDMDSVYSQTKIVLMPSSYESFGLIASEAAQIGIPTIAHPTPGLKENIGEVGILISRENTAGYKAEIDKLMTNKTYYRQLSTKVKKLAIKRQHSDQMSHIIKTIEEL